MSKNLTRKGLALASAFALGASALVAVPAANAAAGDVTISPTSGLNLGAFSTDEFSMTTEVSTLVSPTKLSYKIDNPDKHTLYIDLSGEVAIDAAGAATEEGFATLVGYNALGQEVAINSGTAITVFHEGTGPDFNDSEADEYRGELVVDFGDLNITSLVIHTISAAAATNTIEVQPVEGSGSITNFARIASNADPDALELGDGSVNVSVTAWVEAEATADFSTVDTAYASTKETVKFYDPKGVSAIPSFKRFLDANDTLYLNDTTAGVGAALRFSQADINLDQVDITKWNYKVDTTAGAATVVETAFVAGDRVLKKGFSSYDAGGELTLNVETAADGQISMVTTASYILSVENGQTGGVYFGSVAYNPPSNASDADQVEATVTSTTDAIQTNAADTSVQLRSGSKSFTYTAQAKTADAVKKETASIQMLAVVQSTSFQTAASTITVSGSSETISRVNRAVIVSGFTDSKGQFSVTVTHSAATTSNAYKVTFYVLNGGDDAFKMLNEGVNNAIYTATYEAGTATTLTADSTVLSGTSVTAGFTVTDQFGQVTNLRGTSAVSVEFKASNSANLDKDAAVAANGTVSFNFTNYVVAGAADVITATMYTGTASSPTTFGTPVTVQLYNPNNVAVVQAPASLTADITYKDFLADGTKATTAKPAPDNGVTLTGTVVDANSVGVPAAPVTISGAGLQFKSGDKYYNGKVDVTASAAGVYSVEVFAQKTNSTGVPITITSAGKTATTTLKTYLPATGVNGNNLKFEIVMPANVVKNTTYAVTVKLTDKWGNPVATTANAGTNALSIQGVGSVQINSVDTATSKNFGKDGTTVVFLRSIKDIAGPGSVTATLAAANYSATSAGTATALAVAEIATDVTTTVWNETLFTNSISANVEVLESAASVAKVNVGSFNGKLVVYANGYNGKRISWKVGGRWGSAVASSNTARFDRPTPRRGVTVNVEIYVDGKLELTKSVLTR